MKKVKQFFFTPLNFFWLFVFCVIPFIQSEKIIDPDYIPKMIAFGILLFFASVYFIFYKGKLHFNHQGTLLFLVFLACYLCTAIFSLAKSINMGDSIYDCIRILFPFMFLPVFLAAFKADQFSILMILWLQNMAVIIFSVYGGMQLLDSWNASTNSQVPFIIDYRLSSTLGNKNFFAETMLMLLPFSFAAMLILKSVWKWISRLSVLLIVVELIILKTRSAQLGLAAGLITILLFLVFNSQLSKRFFSSRKNKWIFTAALIIVLISVYKSDFFSNGVSKIKTLTSSFSRDARLEISEGDTVNKNSGFERWFLWRNSIRLFLEHPITGSGIGNWKIFYAKYGVGGAYYLNTGANRFEHPHNEYLLMLSERGLFACMFWMTMFCLLLYYCVVLFRQINNYHERVLVLCMSSGIIFFLVISFFGYPLYRDYSVFLLVLAVSVILHFKSRGNLKAAAQVNYRYFFLATAVFSLFSLYVFGIRYRSEGFMARALKEQSLQHFDRMNYFVSAADHFFFPLDLTMTPLNWYKGFSFFYEQQTDSALVYFLKAEKQSPYHLQVLNDIGACYENKGDHAMALHYFDKALAVTPLYEETMLNKVVTLYNLGKYEDAYNLLHSRKYAWSTLFVSCRRSIIGIVVRSIVGTNASDPLVQSAEHKLTSDDWIVMIENKANGSFTQLREVLIEDLQKK